MASTRSDRHSVRSAGRRTRHASRINQAQVLGVDEEFWTVATGDVKPLSTDELALNERAAAQLKVTPGETVILRVEKPGLFSRDAPLSGEENEVVAIRAKVGRV